MFRVYLNSSPGRARMYMYARSRERLASQREKAWFREARLGYSDAAPVIYTRIRFCIANCARAIIWVYDLVGLFEVAKVYVCFLCVRVKTMFMDLVMNNNL